MVTREGQNLEWPQRPPRKHRVDYSRLDAAIEQCEAVEREMFSALLDAIYPTTSRSEHPADGEQEHCLDATMLAQNPTARPWGRQGTALAGAVARRSGSP